MEKGGQLVSRLIVLAIAIIVLYANHASAQENPSAATLVSRFRTASDAMARASAFHDIRRSLGRENAAVTAAMADSIAKSLARMAIVPDNPLRATDAVRLLVSSADETARVPYPDAFARLREIVEQATDQGTAGAALAAMGDLPDNTLGIQYAASFLEGKRPTDPGWEFLVIRLLASRFGPKGREALDRIDEAGTVQDREARARLRYLRANGYSLHTR